MSIAEEVQEEEVLDCGPVEGRRKQLAVAVPGYAQEAAPRMPQEVGVLDYEPVEVGHRKHRVVVALQVLLAAAGHRNFVPVALVAPVLQVLLEEHQGGQVDPRDHQDSAQTA